MKKICCLVVSLCCLAVGPAAARLPRAEILFTRYDDARGIKALRPGETRNRMVGRGDFEFPLWSPDRTKIAFVEIDEEEFAPEALWVANRDGTDQQKIVDLHGDSAYDIGFDWARDGTKIVYSDQLDPEGSYDLFMVAIESGEVTQVTSEESTDEQEPDWSPTQDEVVYHSAPKGALTTDGEFDVFKIEVNGGNVTQLTDNEWADYSAMWSPDGNSIAFFSTRDDFHSEDGPYSWEIYVMSGDGSEERRVTEQQTRKTGPAWSPDGKSIAYNSRCDDDICGGAYDDNLYVVDLATGKIRRLTGDSERSETSPSWSPDSRWIAFEVIQRGGRSMDLRAVRVRDRRVRRLTVTPRRVEGQPQWSAGRPGGTDLS